MDEFHHEAGVLRCEDVPLSEIAEGAGTPVYVYSYGALERAYRELDEAFSGLDHMVCYAVKANGNLAVLRALASSGRGRHRLRRRALPRYARRVRPEEGRLRGGRQDRERAHGGPWRAHIALQRRVGLGARAPRPSGQQARQAGARRVEGQPGRGRRDPRARRHRKGFRQVRHPPDEALALAERVGQYRSVDLIGVHQHIGSQITKLAPFTESVEKSAQLVEELKNRGFDIRYFNMGGGLGIRYKDEEAPSPEELVAAVRPTLEATGTKILCEMGRYIAGGAGALLTRVIYRKKSGEKDFIVADAGMNDLLRPSLYDAHHEVRAVSEDGSVANADLVGPVCESGDYLARDRELPDAREGDLLAVMCAGAYGFSMASNYNSRPRPAEVLVRGDRWAVVREREGHADLVKGELVPAFL